MRRISTNMNSIDAAIEQSNCVKPARLSLTAKLPISLVLIAQRCREGTEAHHGRRQPHHNNSNYSTHNKRRTRAVHRKMHRARLATHKRDGTKFCQCGCKMGRFRCVGYTLSASPQGRPYHQMERQD
jgi:hypothetical protein